MAKILIVDDRAINRECLSVILSYSGYTAIEADSGPEALRLARLYHPNLIITDILMPGMDGFELFNRLKADPALASTPVIFYTAAFRHEELTGLSAQEKQTTILAKPSEPKAILAAVARALGKPEAARPPSSRSGFDNNGSVERQTVNLQLATLLELGLALAGERELEKLLKLSCRGARDILNVPYAAIAIVDESNAVEYLETIGLAGDARSSVGSRQLDTQFLSAFHPPVRTVLTQAIQSQSRFYGWLYLAGWVEGTALAAWQEQIATNLASQLATTWENLRNQQKAKEELEARVQERTQALQESNLALELEIREHLRTEAELRRSNSELEQMAYVLTHDLQEPLRTVSNFVGLLADRYRGELGNEADLFINFAVDGVSRMQSLITDVLQLALINGSDPSGVQPVAATAAFETAVANLQATIRESGADIQCKPLPPVAVNQEQLSQLFQNLLSNAIKFRSAAAPRISVSAFPDGRAWRFCVQDNGIGIAPAYHQRIFEVFKRLHSRAEYSGTGVGLAICKKIVERHGGNIWVESAPCEGAKFWFTLPDSAASAV